MSDAPTYLLSINASASPEVQMNENALTLEAMSVFGMRPSARTGLTWTYWGGIWGGIAIANGSVALTGEGSPTPANYIVANRQTGVVSVAVNDTTNWLNVALYVRLYIVYTNASAVLSWEDHRSGPHGCYHPTSALVWNQQTDNYTLAAVDADNAVAMSHATAKTVTIPTNAAVPFPVGTTILIYQEGAGSTTVAPDGGVTMNVRAAGSPFLNALGGQYALATVVKRATDEWILTGDIQ